jgi:HPt (histidine-containing phosphotransfer) domain-containing protein
MTQTPPPTDPMAAALARLWTKFLPEIQSRIAILAAAATALENGELPADQQEAAHAAAHKLSGSLGTFGLQRGTEIARQAELALAQSPITTTAAELEAWVTELQALILSRS